MLGGHFGRSGDPLGSILGALGFSWVPSGVLGGALGRPRGPSPIFSNFSLSFRGHFGSILGVKSNQKSDIIFDCFFDRFWVDFWLILEAILEIFLICFDNFRDIAKTGKIARRRGESIKMEG